jgi:hypothetical protein
MGTFHALPVAAVVGLLLARAAPAFCEESDGSHLTPGAALARILVPAGWIAENVNSWVNDHTAYAAPCRTDDVAEELQYLERLAVRDQDLRDVALAQLTHPVVEGNSTASRHTEIAAHALTKLDNDITAIDQLTVRLAALPDCDGAATAAVTPAPPPAPAVAAVPPEPAPPTPTEAADVQSTPAAPAAAGGGPAAPPRDEEVFVVRFDSEMRLHLTPTGVQTLRKAVAASEVGRNVRVAIEGCDDPALADRNYCARRLISLKQMLADKGIKNPGELVGAGR